MDVDAVVLAGGRARRLGGIDKLALTDATGARLLDRVLAAVAGCARVVVVGPPREGLGEAVRVREDPPFAGPVAAVAAALPHVGEGWVIVLAGDQPQVASGVAALRSAAAECPGDVDGVVLVDSDGRRQWLCAVYRASALRAALADATGLADAAGLADADVESEAGRSPSMGRALGHLRLRELPDVDRASDDVDEPDDVSRWLRG